MTFEIDNIELSIDGIPVLNGIYLHSKIGKITGILGSNGTGKSSLLKILFGSLQPQNKLLRIDKKAYLKPLFQSGLVKYLPQHALIPKAMLMGKAFHLYRVDWLNFTSHFPEFSKHKNARADELSGGEIRVVEIYLSLKSESKLVMLDEPFSHIAPLFMAELKQLLNGEKKEKAIILTDHMYRPVIELADELYLLKNGCTKRITDLQDLESYRYLNPDTL